MTLIKKSLLLKKINKNTLIKNSKRENYIINSGRIKSLVLNGKINNTLNYTQINLKNSAHKFKSFGRLKLLNFFQNRKNKNIYN